MRGFEKASRQCILPSPSPSLIPVSRSLLSGRKRHTISLKLIYPDTSVSAGAEVARGVSSSPFPKVIRSRLRSILAGSVGAEAADTIFGHMTGLQLLRRAGYEV
jgi:hypothetical protein